MSARVCRAIFDAFFEDIGRLDAPYGELVDRAFRAHLIPLSDEQLPGEMRAEWRHLRWAWFQAESEDELSAKFAQSPFSAWSRERQNGFMDRLHVIRREINDLAIG